MLDGDGRMTLRQPRRRASCSGSPGDGGRPADPEVPARDRLGPRPAPRRARVVADGQPRDRDHLPRAPLPRLLRRAAAAGGRRGDTGAVVILRDVTRDREHEAETVESERLNAITLLAAGVAHEIGNPLNSLNIHLQLLERELQRLPRGAPRACGSCSTCRAEEVARLDLIITQFLRAIRPTRPNLDRRRVAGRSLQETLSLLKHEIQDRDVLVEVELPEALPARSRSTATRSSRRSSTSSGTPSRPCRTAGVLRISLAGTDRFVAIVVPGHRAGHPAGGAGPASSSRTTPPSRRAPARA